MRKKYTSLMWFIFGILFHIKNNTTRIKMSKNDLFHHNLYATYYIFYVYFSFTWLKERMNREKSISFQLCLSCECYKKRLCDVLLCAPFFFFFWSHAIFLKSTENWISTVYRHKSIQYIFSRKKRRSEDDQYVV